MVASFSSHNNNSNKNFCGPFAFALLSPQNSHLFSYSTRRFQNLRKPEVSACIVSTTCSLQRNNKKLPLFAKSEQQEATSDEEEIKKIVDNSSIGNENENEKNNISSEKLSKEQEYEEEKREMSRSIEASFHDNNNGSDTKLSRFLDSLPNFLQLTRRRRDTQKHGKSSKSNSIEIDKAIIRTAIPSMINLAVVPIVNSVDTFWVGRLGNALALAGQSAANQVTFTIYFLIAFIPNIVAPLVAKAVAEGGNSSKEAQKRVCESIFLCNILGIIGTSFLIFKPEIALQMVLPASAINGPVMSYAIPYLRWRALSIVFSLISSTGFAAYRGMLNTVTPLKVSLVTNTVNLILDPLMIFGIPGGVGGLGFLGAAIATAVSESVGGLIYLRLLFRKKLIPSIYKMLFIPPKLKSIIPLLKGGIAMLIRQMTINAGFIIAARNAQAMDPVTGISAAAYGIVMQIYSVGIVILLSMQSTAAALVPATLNDNTSKTEESNENNVSNINGNNNEDKQQQQQKQQSEGKLFQKEQKQLKISKARKYSDKMISWGFLIGGIVGLTHLSVLPFLVPLFSTIPEVQDAIKIPALITALIHFVNGPVLAGEGIMIGLGCYKDLAILTGIGITTMIACLVLSPLGKSLSGIMLSILTFCIIQNIGVIMHHLKFGPLANRKNKQKSA